MPSPIPTRPLGQPIARGVLIVGLALLVSCVGATTPMETEATPTSAAPPAAAFAPTSAPPLPAPVATPEPPYGRLDVRTVLLEPPADWRTADLCQPEEARWVLPVTQATEVPELLSKLGLDATIAATLERLARCPDGGRCVVEPPIDVVLALSPDDRRALYAVLATVDENTAQHSVLKLSKEHAHLWTHADSLSPRLQQMLSQLAYEDDGRLLLADVSLLCAQANDAAERAAILATVWRVSGRLVTLRLTPSSDIDAIARYWTSPGRRKSIGTFLESLRPREGEIEVDLGHLLPPVARRLLNTFPGPDVAPRVDCVWTARHFFSPRADESRDAGTECVDYVRQHTLAIPFEQRGFGDLIEFATADGLVLHVAVYLADDLVFTKNGATRLQPWHISTIGVIRSLYPAVTALRARRYGAETVLPASKP